MNLKFILILIITLTSTSTSAGVSSLWKDCKEQYRDAWAECNKKYNGKCTYLGPKYKPSCKIGEKSILGKLLDTANSCEDVDDDGACDRLKVNWGNECPPYSTSAKPDQRGYCYPD